MKKKLALLSLIFILATAAVGCGSVGNKINRLNISMSKDEVRALFGANFTARASKVDAEGNLLDLWELYDQKGKTTYQIYFLNDKVSQWGKKEDLQAFPDLHTPTFTPK
ncbi:MAG: hypothetical protein KJ893_00380 [Candidatus Omnitrophica bacterium]|nr:hypothetical protein [Candidatus Omnitrophota bacterium]MBU4478399.1 hypothetical protein [Candidatus Omnitrophota bacterium]MCG2704171.1 hypothetical protein [Candidatus Omnitrophota bacterium]